MSHDLAVSIRPVDPLLFGDNRSARAGEDHGRQDQEPSPGTLYGAIGGRIAAALGASVRHWEPAEPVLGKFQPGFDAVPDREHPPAELLGYCLADRRDRLWFPRPQNLRLDVSGRRIEAGAVLTPVDEGAETAKTSLPSPLRRVTAPVPDPRPEEGVGPLLVSRHLLRLALTGGHGESTLLGQTVDDDLRRPEELYRPDPRLSVAMANDSNLARPGRLFARPYRRFLSDPASGGADGAHFAAWYRVRSLPAQGPASWNGLGFLGGDRRRVELEYRQLPDGLPLNGLLEAVLEAAPGSQGFLAYLLTPGIAPDGPLELEGRQAIGAALGRPRHVSGWRTGSGQPGPRPIRTLVPEGSVYFFDWRDDEDANRRRELLRRLWLGALDVPTGRAGFGRILGGVW